MEQVTFIRNGEAQELPENLSNFRNYTLTEKERLFSVIDILKRTLNYFLGWYLFESNETITNQETIDRYNALKPLKITNSFRLAPGEAKRVARRLQFVSMYWNGPARNYYWRMNRNAPQTNRQLIETFSNSTPSVILNRFKIRESRSNRYNNGTTLSVNRNIFNYASTDWDRAINSMARAGDRSDHWNRDLYFTDLVTDGLFAYDGRTHFGDNVIPVSYNIDSFCADIFIYLKKCLTLYRNMPAFVPEEEEDYTELRDFINNQIIHVNSYNLILSNIGSIDELTIAKNPSTREIKIISKYTLKEPKINILHPSGNIEDNETVIRTIEDIMERHLILNL